MRTDSAGAGKRRFTVDVSQDLHEALMEAHVVDGCGKTTRARILLQLWASDPDLQERVRRVIHEERRARP